MSRMNVETPLSRSSGAGALLAGFMGEVKGGSDGRALHSRSDDVADPRAGKAGRPGLVLLGDGLDQVDDPTPYGDIADFTEGPVQLNRLARAQEAHDLALTSALVVDARTIGLGAAAGQVLIEELHRDAEHLGHLIELAGADPVRTFLVFLHLLECETEMLAQFLLTHPHKHPLHPDAVAHVDVDGVRVAF